MSELEENPSMKNTGLDEYMTTFKDNDSENEKVNEGGLLEEEEALKLLHKVKEEDLEELKNGKKDLDKKLNRRKIRENAFLLVFQLANYKQELSDNVQMIERYFEINNINDDKYQKEIKELIFNYLDNTKEVNEIIKSKLKKGWTLDRLSRVSLALLRIGIAEIKYTDIEYKIIINEVVELSKKYDEIKESKFINGMLANIVKAEGLVKNADDSEDSKEEIALPLEIDEDSNLNQESISKEEETEKLKQEIESKFSDYKKIKDEEKAAREKEIEEARRLKYGDRPDRERRNFRSNDRDGRRSSGPRDGERRSFRSNDRDGRRSSGPRDGERRSSGPRDGERRNFRSNDRDGRRSSGPRDGERRNIRSNDRDGRRSSGTRDGERRNFRSNDRDGRRSSGPNNRNHR